MYSSNHYLNNALTIVTSGVLTPEIVFVEATAVFTGVKLRVDLDLNFAKDKTLVLWNKKSKNKDTKIISLLDLLKTKWCGPIVYITGTSWVMPPETDCIPILKLLTKFESIYIWGRAVGNAMYEDKVVEEDTYDWMFWRNLQMDGYKPTLTYKGNEIFVENTFDPTMFFSQLSDFNSDAYHKATTREAVIVCGPTHTGTTEVVNTLAQAWGYKRVQVTTFHKFLEIAGTSTDSYLIELRMSVSTALEYASKSPIPVRVLRIWQSDLPVSIQKQLFTHIVLTAQKVLCVKFDLSEVETYFNDSPSGDVVVTDVPYALHNKNKLAVLQRYHHI